MYVDELKKTRWDSDTWARILEPGINHRVDYEKDPRGGKYTPEEIALVCFGSWPR